MDHKKAAVIAGIALAAAAAGGLTACPRLSAEPEPPAEEQPGADDAIRIPGLTAGEGAGSAPAAEEPAEAGTEASASEAEGASWTGKIEGGEALAALTPADLASLHSALAAHLGSKGWTLSTAELSLVKGPIADGDEHAVYFYNATANEYLVANSRDGGWNCVKLIETVEGVNDAAPEPKEPATDPDPLVEMWDPSLGAYIGDDVAGWLPEAWAGWGKGPAGDAEGDWIMVDVETVSRDGDVTTFEIVYRHAGEEAARYVCRYDGAANQFAFGAKEG